MNAQDILTYFSYAAALLGLFGTFYYGIKSTRLQRQLTQFAWTEVEHGVDMLCKKVTHEFPPDVILTLSLPGKIISSLMMIRSLRVAHDITAVAIRGNVTKRIAEDYFVVATGKFSVGVPKSILSFDQQNILIVDSAVVTGDLLSQVITLLHKKGVPADKIRSATLIVTEFAIQSGKAPTYYWKTVRDAEYTLPWGNLSTPWY